MRNTTLIRKAELPTADQPVQRVVASPARLPEMDAAISAIIRDPENVEALDRLGAALEDCRRLGDALNVYRYRLEIKHSDAIASQISLLTNAGKRPNHERLHVTKFAFDPMDSFLVSLNRILENH